MAHIPLKSTNKFKKLTLKPMANLILTVLFSLVITVACFALQPNPLSEVAAGICSNNIIFLYNSLPVFLSLSFLFLVTCNVFYSAAAVSTFWVTASIINRYKILYRDDPFVTIDISVGAEAVSIIAKTFMGIDLGLLLAAALSDLVLVTAGACILWRSHV